MKTFILWLEPEQEIPEFKRLRFKVRDLPVQDIIQKGIHPKNMKENYSCYNNCEINDRITEILNETGLKIPELEGSGYCEDISEYSSYCYSRDDFEQNARRISNTIYFVDELDYPTLLAIAKRRLTETWSHTTVLNLAKWIYQDFNDLRDFLKSKDKNLSFFVVYDISSFPNYGATRCFIDFSQVGVREIGDGCQRGVIQVMLPALDE